MYCNTNETIESLIESANSSTSVSVDDPVIVVTEIGSQGLPGPQGDPGPQGPPGPPGPGGSDANYIHVQSLAQSTWTVVHNLNKYPSVTIVDSGDSTVQGDIHYDSLNQLTVSFTASFGGRAFLN